MMTLRIKRERFKLDDGMLPESALAELYCSIHDPDVFTIEIEKDADCNYIWIRKLVVV